MLCTELFAVSPTKATRVLFIFGGAKRMIGVAFGLRGTLVSDGDVEQLAFRRVATKHANRLHLILDEERLDLAIDRLTRTDGIRRSEFPGAVSRALHVLLGGNGQIGDLEADFRRSAAALVADVVQPLPDTRETLAQLASLGIPRAILTNDMSSVAKREAELIGFDGPLLIAEDIDAWKPDRAAFDLLAATLGLQPARIWFVGVNLERDVDAAREAGFQTIWLDRDGAGNRAHLTEPGTTVSALTDIPAIFAEHYTRSLLGLRYVYHNALEWRPGHFVPGVEYGLDVEQ